MKKRDPKTNQYIGKPKVSSTCLICKQKISFFQSKPHKYCSLTCYHKDLKNKIGELHHMWNGGNARKRKTRREAEGRHTKREWQELKEKFDFMCLCCKKVEPLIKLTRDHVIPLSRGGTDYISNIQPLCLSCNDRKGVKTIDFSGIIEIIL